MSAAREPLSVEEVDARGATLTPEILERLWREGLKAACGPDPDERRSERCWHCLKLVEPHVAARAFNDRRRPCCDRCRGRLFGKSP